MLSKKVINPDFSHLESRLQDIVAGNYTPDFVFCNKRNVVEKIIIDGEAYVVKKYKRPQFINRIAYRFFRKSKARRAYEYALQLLSNGVDTPRPVAYFETYKNGLFDTGYFISEFMPHSLLNTVYDAGVCGEERRLILSEFIDFLGGLHANGVVPMDLNAGNVFYHKEGAGYKFALTDINRMKFGVVAGAHDVMRSLEQCFYPMEQLYGLVMLYCEKSGQEPLEVMYEVLSLRIKRRKRNRFKRKMKAKIKK